VIELPTPTAQALEAFRGNRYSTPPKLALANVGIGGGVLEQSGPFRRRSFVRDGSACGGVVRAALADLHFVPSAVHLGCRVAGGHFARCAPRGQ
jgi:hypothetical protein